jgi:8-oxo-dGTP diphosphatase
MARLGKSQREKDVVRVASVAAFRDGKILFGKRNDNGKWTLPGGHLEENEKPAKGAVRELYEESSLKPKSLAALGCETLDGKDGKQIEVYAFRADVDGDASGELDPDEECTEWRWVDPDKIPDEIMGNLHSKKNVTLHLLGLQKAAPEAFDADEAAWPEFESGITAEEARRHEMLRRRV